MEASISSYKMPVAHPDLEEFMKGTDQSWKTVIFLEHRGKSRLGEEELAGF